jgi:hypothetical protein
MDSRIDCEGHLGGKSRLMAAWIRLKSHLRAGDQCSGEGGDLEAGDPAQSGIGGLARRSRCSERVTVIQSVVGAEAKTEQLTTASQLRPLGRVPPPTQGDIEPMAIQRLAGARCKGNQTARIDELAAIHTHPSVRIEPSRRQAP